jgi:hypothetical protein
VRRPSRPPRVAGLRPRAFPESGPARGASNPRALQRSRHEQESRNCRRTERQAPIPGARALPRPPARCRRSDPRRRLLQGPQLLRQQLPRAGRRPAPGHRPPRTAWPRTASAWRRCASSAARRPPQELEASDLEAFLGTEDTILYGSCFDANGGLFETLLGERTRSSPTSSTTPPSSTASACARPALPLRNNDLADLEAQLQAADAAGVRKLIATDGVFSMDGDIADLKSICDLADKYGALVMVDDCHAVGFVGTHGPRHAEHCGVHGPRGHHHRHARQGPGRRLGAASPPGARRSSNCCASARGPTCSPTPWRPRIVAEELPRSASPSRSCPRARPASARR